MGIILIITRLLNAGVCAVAYMDQDRAGQIEGLNAASFNSHANHICSTNQYTKPATLLFEYLSSYAHRGQQVWGTTCTLRYIVPLLRQIARSKL